MPSSRGPSGLRLAHLAGGNEKKEAGRYLLGGLSIARVNQVWCAGITYIPMARGLSLPGGHHGLGEPSPVGVAAVGKS